MTNSMCNLRANKQQCLTKGKKGETMRGPCMIFKGTRHMMEMISLCDVHLLVGCIEEFCMMKLKTLKVWLCVLMIFVLAVNHMSWWFQRQLWNYIILTIRVGNDSVFVNDFCINRKPCVLMISALIAKFCCVDDSYSVVTQFLLMISTSIINHMRWWFQC